MSILDDNIIDKIDLQLLKNMLIEYLMKHSWYEDLTNPNNLPVQICCCYVEEQGMLKLKRVVQHRYKIYVDEINKTIKLVVPDSYQLTLVLKYDEELPDFVLECIAGCNLNIIRGEIVMGVSK